MPRNQMIKLRSGTAAQWATADAAAGGAAVAAGETVMVDGDIVKGTGSTAVALLPRVGSGTYAHPQGAWSSATAYTPMAVVTYGGSTYRAVAGSTNVTPGTDGGVTWEAWGGGGGGAVASVVGQTGAVTGAQILADATVSAALAGKALVNAADVGFDLIIAAGQSNMMGTGGAANAYEDPIDCRVWQVAQQGTYNGKLIGAVDPLAFTTSAGLSPATVFARWYASVIPTNRRVLIVPLAVGATSIQVNWDPSGSGNLYTGAITAVQAALTAAGANSRVGAILWIQGEADSSYSGANYETKLTALIAGWRSSFGSASTPFIIGGMLPENVTGTVPDIKTAQAGTPGSIPYTGYAAGPSGYDAGDHLHYLAPGLRILGRSMFNAYLSAMANSGAPAVPGTPTGLAATPGVSQVALTWTAPAISAGNALTDYVVQYRTTSGPGAWTTFADGTSTVTSATVTGLTNSTSYDFRVAAVDATGIGTYSASVTATPIVTTVPGAPTSLTLSPGNASVGLAWTAPASNGGSSISDYTIQYRTPNGSGAWTTFSHTASAGTSITVTGLTNGSAYGFQVAAVNAIGAGTFTAEAVGTPASTGMVDTFTGTNGTALTSHTSDSGHTWSNASGAINATIQGNALSVTPGSGTFPGVKSSFTPASADYSVTLDLSPSSAATVLGPAARVATTTQGTFYAMFPGSNPNTFGLWFFNNGSNGQIAVVSPTGGVSTTETYRMTITCAGTAISGKVQRLSDSQYLTSGGAWQAGTTTALSGTNSAITAAGNPGIACTGGGVIDNFSAA